MFDVSAVSPVYARAAHMNLADALVRGEANGVAGLLAITMNGPDPGTGRVLTMR